jgi:hypothetical protein
VAAKPLFSHSLVGPKLPLFDDDSDSGNEDANMEGGADADARSVESENAGEFEYPFASS